MDQKHRELIDFLSSGAIVTQSTKELKDYEEEWQVHETLLDQLMQKKNKLFGVIPQSELQSFKEQLDLQESLFKDLKEKKTTFFNLLPKD